MSFPAVSLVRPAHVAPGLLIAYSQNSGAFETLSGGKPRVELSTGDQYVYRNTLKVTTRAAAGQSAGNKIPSPSLVAGVISTPTYLVRSRAEFDHHDAAAAGSYNVDINQAYRLAMRQSIFQFMRMALLYGVTPSAGEGLVNTIGATTVNFPPDPAAQTTLATMATDWISSVLLKEIGALQSRINAISQDGTRIVILAPQRVLSQFNFRVVTTTNFQRPGAGSNSISGVVQDVGGWNRSEISFVADDTLVGKGTAGTDAIVITAPDVDDPNRYTTPNTNEFAKLQPGERSVNVQYVDKAAPTEIPTPIPGGGTDVVSELRVTSGWCQRPEAITILSVAP